MKFIDDFVDADIYRRDPKWVERYLASKIRHEISQNDIRTIHSVAVERCKDPMNCDYCKKNCKRGQRIHFLGKVKFTKESVI